MTRSTSSVPTHPLRRRGLTLGAAALLALLTACGGGGGGGDAPDAPEAAAAEPRTIEDQYGEVTVEGTPSRVVTPGNPETDTALALGVVPVAMGQWLQEEDGASPWRRELLDGAQPELIRYNPDGYDIEETLAFRPDLVLAGFDMEENPYRQLSEVVPTISMPYGTSGEDLTQALGRALGKEAEAEELIAQTREETEETKAANPALDGLSVSIADGSSPGVLFDVTTTSLGYGMLEDLGLRVAPGSDGRKDYAEVPAEQWSTFDGDLLVVSYFDPASQEKQESNPLFQRIPAVQAGHYLALTDPDDVELLRSAALPQVRYALEHLVPRLTDAAE